MYNRNEYIIHYATDEQQALQASLLLSNSALRAGEKATAI